MREAVDVREVYKAYPVDQGLAQMFHRARKQPALEGVSMSIRTGECFGILGVNGAGKTTLLKMIGTLIVPDSGHVRVMGYDVVRDARDVRTVLGVCGSGEDSFYMRLTARQNLEFFGKLQGLPRRRVRNRIDELSAWMGLADRLPSSVRSFSTGMRQRLSLVRALLADPPVLLLDEPTKALDPISAHELRRSVRETLVGEQRKTVLVATNQLEEAWAICDRVAVLHARKVAAVGTPMELEARAPARSREQPLIGYLREVAGALS